MEIKFKLLLGIMIVMAAFGGYMLFAGGDEKVNDGVVVPDDVNVTPKENTTTDTKTNETTTVTNITKPSPLEEVLGPGMEYPSNPTDASEIAVWYMKQKFGGNWSEDYAFEVKNGSYGLPFNVSFVKVYNYTKTPYQGNDAGMFNLSEVVLVSFEERKIYKVSLDGYNSLLEMFGSFRVENESDVLDAFRRYLEIFGEREEEIIYENGFVLWVENYARINSSLEECYEAVKNHSDKLFNKNETKEEYRKAITTLRSKGVCPPIILNITKKDRYWEIEGYTWRFNIIGSYCPKSKVFEDYTTEITAFGGINVINKSEDTFSRPIPCSMW